MDLLKIINNLALNPLESFSSENFNRFPTEKWNNFLINKEEQFWQKYGEKMALNLFHKAAENIPAYKKFLKSNQINPKTVKTITDFQKVPPITKKNYLRFYPMPELFFGGNFNNLHTISVSSGSTGEPFFWPRGSFQEFDTTFTHELFLRYLFSVDKKNTLLIVAYSMGMYIAGPFTFSSGQKVSIKGYPLVITTPGISRADVVRVIKNLSPKFEQTILASYPPFAKDILDACEIEKINLKKIKIKFIFGAESFSEEWREYILHRVNSNNPFTDSVNTYGSADAAILGHETPLSILARKLAAKNITLNCNLFHNDRLPSLHQYNPLLRYFETINKNELVFTAYGGIPLIRYSIGDNGGLLTYQNVIQKIEENGVNINNWKKEYHLSDSIWELPFVYLFGRKDFTCTLYGLNIYPENIKAALLHKLLQKYLTGKFTMSQIYDKNQDQHLSIRLELKNQVNLPENFTNQIQKIITSTLRDKNKEYNRLFEAINDKALPQISLENYGDKKYFLEGVKQKWVQ